MATNKNLANATSVTSLLNSNSIMVEVGGSIRRITLEDFLGILADGLSELSASSLEND